MTVKEIVQSFALGDEITLSFDAGQEVSGVFYGVSGYFGPDVVDIEVDGVSMLVEISEIDAAAKK